MEKEIESLKLANEQVKFATSLVQHSTAKVIAIGAVFTFFGYLIGKAV